MWISLGFGRGHIQQYFSYFMVISFIDGRQQCSWREVGEGDALKIYTFFVLREVQCTDTDIIVAVNFIEYPEKTTDQQVTDKLAHNVVHHA